MGLRLDVFPKSLVKASYESAEDDGQYWAEVPTNWSLEEKKITTGPGPFIMRRGVVIREELQEKC